MKVKRSIILFTILMVTISFIFIQISCKKEDVVVQVPVLTTSNVSNITQTTATIGGNVSSDGGATVTARGVCWSTGQTPTTTDSKTKDGKGTGSFKSNLTGLTVNTTYYVRAYAINSAGTGYGSIISLTTLQETVTDYDGNVYNTVVIGTQTWIVENLKVTHYRNGDPITNITVNTAWPIATIGAYCWYDNDIANKTTYGALYNWHTVSDSRGLAPEGWHVPTDNEWSTLINYLGGSSVAGGKLKETGITHWNSPNVGATNESGFTGLPSGSRITNGSFKFMGINGTWWSATERSSGGAWYWNLGNYSSVDRDSHNKEVGFSVCCVKD